MSLLVHGTLVLLLYCTEGYLLEWLLTVGYF